MCAWLFLSLPCDLVDATAVLSGSSVCIPSSTAHPHTAAHELTVRRGPALADLLRLFHVRMACALTSGSSESL